MSTTAEKRLWLEFRDHAALIYVPIVDAAALLPTWQYLGSVGSHFKAGGVRIEASTTGGSASCPGCGATSARVHRRYLRRLVDAAIGGRACW